MQKNPTKVINFKFEEKYTKMMDEIQKDLWLSSRAAVVKRSLLLLEAVTKSKGIYIRENDGTLTKIVIII